MCVATLDEGHSFSFGKASGVPGLSCGSQPPSVPWLLFNCKHVRVCACVRAHVYAQAYRRTCCASQCRRAYASVYPCMRTACVCVHMQHA